MKRAAFILAALALVPVITEAAVARRARYLMGTVCEVAVPGGHEAEVELAFAEAKRIEQMLSTWIETSELSRLNRAIETGVIREPGVIPSEVEGSPDSGDASTALGMTHDGDALTAQGTTPELRALLAKTVEWSRRTNSAFNPRIKSLIDAWKTRDDGAVPRREVITRALESEQWEEGAFGKGYALDRMLAKLTPREAMIDFGGQLIVRGELRVSIADPTNREHPVLAFTMRDASLSTSSGSEKTFQVDGRRFSHILDPRTGEALPPRGSASVIAEDAMTADILSTALYVMGEEEALRWAGANNVALIFINSNRNVRLSARARERVRELELLDRNFSVKD